MKETKKIVK